MKLPAYEQGQLDTIGATLTTDYLLENYRRRPSIMETFDYLQKEQEETGFKQGTARQISEAIGRGIQTVRGALMELEKVGAISRWDCWEMYSNNDYDDVQIVVGDDPRPIQGYEVYYIHYAYTAHKYLIPTTKEGK